MPRVKRGTKRRQRRKKILERASGYFLTKSKLYRAAKESVERGLKFAYSGRKQKKRQFRAIWIVRIGAAAKLHGISYNRFISGLKFAYSGRKQKKRQFRAIWIVRIGAAARLNGLTYSHFINGLKRAGVELDRKVLADIALKDPAGFTKLAEQAKAARAAA
jgi:large subunit ribosomal protein L20